MTSQDSQQNDSLSLGEHFRQARETLGLSIEQVSEKINLRPSILQYIENNELVHKNIPAIFMQGYVRSYARFLRLPEELIQASTGLFGEPSKNDLTRGVNTKKISNSHSHGRWIGYLTLLVLLVVGGMTALWWWENYQQSNSERDNLVQNYVSNDNQQSANTISPVIETQPAEKVEVAPTTVEQITVEPNQTTAIEPKTEQNVTVTAQEPVATTAPENHSTGMPAPVMPNNGTDILANQTNLNQEQSAEQTQTEQAPVAVNGDLQIEITSATSWITVKDNKRRNLAQKEYKQGEVLTFDGKGPYALTIGAPANVKIIYKGEVYPLKIDGRVARIKLQ